MGWVSRIERRAEAPLGAVDAQRRLAIAIVAPVRATREALAAAFVGAASVAVSGSFGSDDQLVDALSACAATVALVDVSGPVALELVRSVIEAGVSRVVAFGIPRSGDVLVACAQQNVSGLIAEDVPLTELAEALERVAAGEDVCTPALASDLAGFIASLSPSRRLAHSDLTRREREVAELIAEGLTNKEIASRLFLSVSTVKTHVHSILEKLRLEDRRDIASALPPA